MISFDRRTVEFGAGDIEILMGAEEGRGLLILKNVNEPGPIGNPEYYARPISYEVQRNDMVMSFSCRESIDAVIQSLQKIRDAAFPVQNEASDEQQ